MLAVITARGGSKRLPDKNIKLLCGKPLIAYTIEAALKAESVTRLIISTDSHEIASISKEYGAEVPFMRPKKLAADETESIEVFKHALRWFYEQEGINYPSFMVLQPTSPFRTSSDIDSAAKLFNEKDADSVVSYCKERHPVSWHKYLSDEGRFEEIGISKNNRATYYPNGAIYILRTNLLKKNTYYTSNSFAYLMDYSHSVDIDTLEDFEYAEFLMKKNNA